MKNKYDNEVIERFWNKVNIKDENSCWEWTAASQSRGYVSFIIGKGKTALAHRLVKLLKVKYLKE